jgi:hypothetical protein
MVLNAFSIRDSKAEAFNTPFFQKTKGEAIRSFESAVNDGKTQLNQYPEDFDLYHVGEWDDATGKIKPLDTPNHVIKAIEVAKKPAQPVQIQS